MTFAPIPLRAQTGPAIANWIKSEPLLLKRAQQIISQDERDSSALFPDWVQFMLFGATHRDFNLNAEPAHDGRAVMDLKSRIDRDDFNLIRWSTVRSAVTAQ